MLQACSWDNFVDFAILLFLVLLVWEKMCFMLMDATLLFSADTEWCPRGLFKDSITEKVNLLSSTVFHLEEDTAVRILDTPPDFISMKCLFHSHCCHKTSCLVSLFWTGQPDLWMFAVECWSHLLNTASKRKRPSDFSWHGLMWHEFYSVWGLWLRAVISFYNSFYNTFDFLPWQILVWYLWITVKWQLIAFHLRFHTGMLSWKQLV